MKNTMRERRTAARTAARRGAAALLLLGVMIAVLIVLNAVLSAPRLAAVEEGQVGEIGTPHPPRMRRPKAGEYDDDEEGVDKEEDKEEDNDEGNDKGSEDDEDDEEGGEDDENDEKDEKDEKDEEEEDTQDGTVEALGVEWRLTPLGTARTLKYKCAQRGCPSPARRHYEDKVWTQFTSLRHLGSTQRRRETTHWVRLAGFLTSGEDQGCASASFTSTRVLAATAWP